MVRDGDLRCTTVTVVTGFSRQSSWCSFDLCSPFSWSCLSAASLSFSIFSFSNSLVPFRSRVTLSLRGLSDWFWDSWDDWLWDRLLSPPSGVRLVSCSDPDNLNLFKLSFRTSELDFFFSFFNFSNFFRVLPTNRCHQTTKFHSSISKFLISFFFSFFIFNNLRNAKDPFLNPVSLVANRIVHTNTLICQIFSNYRTTTKFKDEANYHSINFHWQW